MALLLYSTSWNRKMKKRLDKVFAQFSWNYQKQNGVCSFSLQFSLGNVLLVSEAAPSACRTDALMRWRCAGGEAFSKPVKPQSHIAAITKRLCQAACSYSVLCTENSNNILPLRSCNLHNPSRQIQDKKWRTAESRGRWAWLDSLKRNALPQAKVLRAREGSC